MTKISLAILLIGLLSAGCAAINVEERYEAIKDESLLRTGHTISWERTPRDRTHITDIITKRLDNGLTREEAIQLSVINNQQLQTAFQSLGIAEADIVQAGLYTNPSLGALLRVPTRSGSGTGVELDVLFRISDLWNVPLRKDVAEVEALRITQLVIQEILQTAAAARDAFDDVLLQEALHRFMVRNVSLFHTTVEELRVRFHAGLVNDLDIYLAENVLFEGQVDLARIKSALVTARARLVETLGLDPIKLSAIELSGDLEKMPLRTLSPTQGWKFAKQHRTDLQLNRLQIQQTQRLLQLQKARVFGDVGIGGNYTRELDKQQSVGPVLVLQLPIFNQNQGGIARAEYQLKEARQQLQATELRAKQDIQRLLGELSFHETHARLFREQMLVAQQKALSYVERFYSTMQLNSIFLIEARRRILDTQRGYFQALRAYRRTESQLQVALGAIVPGGGNR